ncbi:hypothetical protein HYFRA_00004629 [Hymenoscyphus fraxineus]|uniref:RxLR effector protein n=1 Tax=Hymenoscyphus fraxineus TaxID=746836 RepID=A0A9N9KX66_9HELO|nr:hypothetical protein HYFRA_00004629 [Hymenoscyphus fraxineus]
MHFFTLPIWIAILSTAATLPTQPNAHLAQIAARNVAENANGNAVSIATPSVLLRRTLWPGRPDFLGGNRLAYKEAQMDKKRKAYVDADRSANENYDVIETSAAHREDKANTKWAEYLAAQRKFQKAQEKAAKKATNKPKGKESEVLSRRLVWPGFLGGGRTVAYREAEAAKKAAAYEASQKKVSEAYGAWRKASDKDKEVKLNTVIDLEHGANKLFQKKLAATKKLQKAHEKAAKKAAKSKGKS